MTILKVDFKQKQGEIRRINGVNLAPRVTCSSLYDMNTPFKALNAPISRFHDAPLDNPGVLLVDPNLIFANWHADVDDPRNYDFRQTDDYLKNCRDLGTDIHYRLGPSIELSVEKYFIYPPEDFDKWVDICSNIIRHYNEGWGNGFAWDIKYWTIWEEPENVSLWKGEPIQFFRLFKLAVTRLKKRFPSIKLGTCVGNHLPPQWVADYLTYCRDEKVPMDFFGWSMYMGDLNKVIEYPNKIRKLIDGYGFKDTELHVAEWNYTNSALGFISKEANESPEGCYGYNAAAFGAGVLIGWQDTPLTMANYYTASMLMGLFDQYAVPKTVYYGLLAFGEMTEYKCRVKATSGIKDIKILAGLNSEDKGAILVTAFKSEETKLELSIKGMKTDKIEVFCINNNLNLEPIKVKSEKNRVVLDNSSGSSVFLIKGIDCTA